MACPPALTPLDVAHQTAVDLLDKLGDCERFFRMSRKNWMARRIGEGTLRRISCVQRNRMLHPRNAESCEWRTVTVTAADRHRSAGIDHVCYRCHCAP